MTPDILERDIALLDASYDVDLKLIQSVNGHIKELKEAIAKGEKDPTRVGTNLFETLQAAERYYGCYGFRRVREVVQAKLKDKEIRIGYPDPRLKGHWDEDRRWHIEGNPMVLTWLEELQRYLTDESRLSKVLDDARALRYALSRTIIGWPKRQEAKSWAAVERLLGEPWEEERPYCCEGCPCYTTLDFDREYQKPLNNRVVLFDGAVIVKLRQLSYAKDPHWGMSQLPSVYLVMHGENKTFCTYLTEIRRAIPKEHQ